MFEKARAIALKAETRWIWGNCSLQEWLEYYKELDPDEENYIKCIPQYKRDWRNMSRQQLCHFKRDQGSLSDPVEGHMKVHLLKMKYTNKGYNLKPPYGTADMFEHKTLERANV